MKLLAITALVVAVFSAGSEATYPHIGKNPWDPTRPNHYDPNAGVNSHSFSNPHGGVNSNSFRSSFDLDNDDFGDESVDRLDRRLLAWANTRIWCQNKCAKESRVCVSMIPGVVRMPNDDYVRSQVRKCSARSKACLARC